MGAGYHRSVIGNPAPVALAFRWAYLAAGLAFVGLGVVGAMLPIMPSTIFFILALWAFKRSSPRLERRLLEHPVVGPTLRDWDANRSIKPRTKIVAVALIWVCLTVSAIVVASLSTTIALAIVGVALTAFLITRPPA